MCATIKGNILLSITHFAYKSLPADRPPKPAKKDDNFHETENPIFYSFVRSKIDRSIN